MKYLILALAVVVLLWLLRTSLRNRAGSPPPSSSQDALGPQPMLACAQCGVHLPRDEVLPGRGGVFCGDEHRAAFERSHPE